MSYDAGLCTKQMCKVHHQDICDGHGVIVLAMIATFNKNIQTCK